MPDLRVLIQINAMTYLCSNQLLFFCHLLLTQFKEEETSPAGASQRQIDEASKDFTKLHQHQNVDQRVLPPLQTLLTNTNLQKPLNYGAVEQSDSYCQEPKQHDGLKSLSGHKFTEANKPVQALAVTKEASLVVESLVSRLTTASRFMESSVPLLDEGLVWKESLGEFLLDQADFLVVGVLGRRSSFECEVAGNTTRD